MFTRLGAKLGVDARELELEKENAAIASLRQRKHVLEGKLG
jgi:hypothetical protein